MDDSGLMGDPYVYVVSPNPLPPWIVDVEWFVSLRLGIVFELATGTDCDALGDDVPAHHLEIDALHSLSEWGVTELAYFTLKPDPMLPGDKGDYGKVLNLAAGFTTATRPKTRPDEVLDRNSVNEHVKYRGPDLHRPRGRDAISPTNLGQTLHQYPVLVASTTPSATVGAGTWTRLEIHGAYPPPGR
ncbi:hypothetical protein LZ30DRAFT_684077 [Colletotrichum cereale]|nr:hypothetical protein LZ30DRAFT_684077 [Colletotrichum cereale]